jgi:hypothetical protein
MPETRRLLLAQAEELTAAVTQLRDSVEHLDTRMSLIDTRMSRNERNTKLMTVALGAVAVLAVVVAALFWRLQVTNARIDAWCAVNAIFLGSYDPDSRKPGPDRDKYNQAFDVLRDSYRQLGCSAPLVPPRTDQPPPPR